MSTDGARSPRSTKPMWFRWTTSAAHPSPVASAAACRWRVILLVSRRIICRSVLLRPCKTVQQRFGAHVRKLRKARGWSQEELAHRTGRHWTYIGCVERGERNPTLRVIADLAKALEVPIRKLF